jgi:FkbM family methyltransferase
MKRLLPTRAERCGQSVPVALWRIGAGAVRRRVLGKHSARVELGGRGVFVDADLDTAIGLQVYRHGWCDAAADAAEYLVGPGGVVIDGGANIGAFSLVAASVVGPGGEVHAIEAAPATAALLRRSVAANPGYAIQVHELALADAEGELELTTFEAGSGSASLAASSAGDVVRVRATTLDVLTAGLDRVDLVKLDVEGAELRALRGAERLLAEGRPVLLIELEPDHLARQGGSVAQLETLLADAGYAAYELARKREGIAFLPMASPWRRPRGEPNVVLIPTELRDQVAAAMGPVRSSG